MHIVIIRADYNDADYVTSVHEMNDSEVSKFFSTIHRLKNSENFNEYRFDWTNGDCGDVGDMMIKYGDSISEEDVEYLDDMFPYHEYGIHSIDSIKIYSGKDISTITLA